MCFTLKISTCSTTWPPNSLEGSVSLPQSHHDPSNRLCKVRQGSHLSCFPPARTSSFPVPGCASHTMEVDLPHPLCSSRGSFRGWLTLEEQPAHGASVAWGQWSCAFCLCLRLHGLSGGTGSQKSCCWFKQKEQQWAVAAFLPLGGFHDGPLMVNTSSIAQGPRRNFIPCRRC